MSSEFLYWDETSEQFELLVSELRRAYMDGYSVIELARLLHHRTATKLYAEIGRAHV